MATMRDRIEILVDVVSGEASKSLKGIQQGLKTTREEIAKQPGVVGKAKAGLKGFVDTWNGLDTAAKATAITGAAAAAVKFGSDMIAASQDVALSAGKMADATGLSVDQASRWNEVAGDIGVSTETLTSSFGKFTKQVGESPQAIQDLGVEIAHAKDGTVDMNGTILNAIDTLNGVKDPAERAALAAKLFGKGWQGAAELLTTSAGDVEAALAGVSDAKVINPEELKRARDFRATLDQLNDVLDDLKISIGQELVDAVGPALQTFGEFATSVDKLSQKLSGLRVGQIAGQMLKMDSPITGLMGAFNALADSSQPAWKRVTSAIGAAVPFADKIPLFARNTDKATKAQKERAAQEKLTSDAIAQEAQAESMANDQRSTAIDLIDQMNQANRSLADLTEDVEKQQAKATAALADGNKATAKQREVILDARDAQRDLADTTVKQAQAQAQANGTTLSAAQSQAVWNQSMLKSASTATGPMRTAILQYVAQVNGIPPEKATAIQAAIDHGDLALAEQLLDQAARDRQSTITAQADLTAWYQAWNAAIMQAKQQGQNLRQSIVGFQTGGVAGPGGEWAWVGESGRELVHLPSGARVFPHGTSERMGAGGGAQVVNIHVNVSGIAQPAEVGKAIVSSLHAYERANGKQVLLK